MPVEIKEIQAGYLNSFHFKDICLYLEQNKLPASKAAIRKVDTLAERYIVLNSLLLKITPEKGTTVLVIWETCTNKNYNLVPFQFVCRTPECHKDLLNYQWQMFQNLIHILGAI